MRRNQLIKMYNLEGYMLDSFECKNEDIFLYCHLKLTTLTYKSQRSKKVSTSRIRKIKHQVREGKTVWLMVEQRKFYFSKYDKRLQEKPLWCQKL